MKNENKYDGMYTLQYVTGRGDKTITIELEGGLTRQKVLNEIQTFLQACGYNFALDEKLEVARKSVQPPPMEDWPFDGPTEFSFNRLNNTTLNDFKKKYSTLKPYPVSINLSGDNMGNYNYGINSFSNTGSRVEGYGAVPPIPTNSVFGTKNPVGITNAAETTFKFEGK